MSTDQAPLSSAFNPEAEAKKLESLMLGERFARAAIANDDVNPNALKPGIEVVAVDNTANWFPRDPLAEIYHFRGLGVDELGWRDHINFMDTPVKGLHSETDNSDMQGTVYFVKRFVSGDIACVVRVHPSIDKYGRDLSMIGKNIPHLIDHDPSKLPLAPDFYETSRIIIDNHRLPSRLPDGSKNPDRKQASKECLAASALYCASQGIKGYFCFMPKKIWQVAYETIGLEVIPLAGEKDMRDTPDGEPYKVYAGKMYFTQEALQKIRDITGLAEDMLDYGPSPQQTIARILRYGRDLERAGQSPEEKFEKIFGHVGPTANR